MNDLVFRSEENNDYQFTKYKEHSDHFDFSTREICFDHTHVHGLVLDSDKDCHDSSYRKVLKDNSENIHGFKYAYKCLMNWRGLFSFALFKIST